MTSAVLNQVSFRARGDTVGLNVNTWDYALNANFIRIVDTNFRVRFTIAETAGGHANNTAYSLQYNLNGAGFVAIGVATPIQVTISNQFANGDPTTQLISTGTFVAGIGVEQTTTSNITLNSSRTEVEWCLHIDNAQVSHGDTIVLRVVQGAVGSETVLDVYTNSPTITVLEPVNITLTADAGAFTLTGTEVDLTAVRAVITSTGSFVLTGSPAALGVGSTLIAQPGSFDLIGQPVTLSELGTNSYAVVSYAAIEAVAIPSIIVTLDIAIETDIALDISAIREVEIVSASETDTAFDFTYSQSLILDIAVETDTALEITVIPVQAKIIPPVLRMMVSTVQ